MHIAYQIQIDVVQSQPKFHVSPLSCLGRTCTVDANLGTLCGGRCLCVFIGVVVPTVRCLGVGINFFVCGLWLGVYDGGYG